MKISSELLPLEVAAKNPASHMQGKPLALAGQGTTLQLLAKNVGATVDGCTTPLKPTLQEHPETTSAPLLLRGHVTLTQDPVYTPPKN